MTMTAAPNRPTVRQAERLLKRLARVITVREEETVAAAAKKMGDNDVGCLIVLNRESQVTGVVSERDIIRKVVGRSANPAKTAVADIMNSDVIACRMDTSIGRAQRLMTGHGIRHLPIIEDGVPLGMISSRDILAYRLSRTKAIARQQSQILDHLERKHPEIAEWHRDATGRIIIN
jgi:CBS domain-containing protein